MIDSYIRRGTKYAYQIFVEKFVEAKPFREKSTIWKNYLQKFYDDFTDYMQPVNFILWLCSPFWGHGLLNHQIQTHQTP